METRKFVIIAIVEILLLAVCSGIAFILFKYLPNDAIIEGAVSNLKVNASGAYAGFVFCFFLANHILKSFILPPSMKLKIRGNVYLSTNKPAVKAEVYVDGISKNEITNGNGLFEIELDRYFDSYVVHAKKGKSIGSFCIKRKDINENPILISLSEEAQLNENNQQSLQNQKIPIITKISENFNIFVIIIGIIFGFAIVLFILTPKSEFIRNIQFRMRFVPTLIPTRISMTASRPAPTYSSCTTNPAPIPPPSPYVYSDAVPSDMAISGGWGKMPEDFQDYISVKPYEGSDHESKSDGHSLAFHFDFGELTKEGKHADSLTIAVLSRVDCWGKDAVHPCLPSYDLSQYTRLVFWAKGEQGDERLIAKAAVLTDTPCGDSVRRPLRKAISLTQDWQQFEIQIPRERVNLTRIISPFAIEVFARDQNSEVTVYVDDIHYE